jgi:hypothetical protein
VKRLSTLAFAGLAVATVAAFFIIQHLKVSTPLIAGNFAPFPTAINPGAGGTCVARTPDGRRAPVNYTRTHVSFFLVHQSDRVSVYVVSQDGKTVAALASGVHMPALLYPHQVARTFTWNGRESGGRLAPTGKYYVKIVLLGQDRTIDITNPDGQLDWIDVVSSPRCPGAMNG